MGRCSVLFETPLKETSCYRLINFRPKVICKCWKLSLRILTVVFRVSPFSVCFIEWFTSVIIMHAHTHTHRNTNTNIIYDPVLWVFLASVFYFIFFLHRTWRQLRICCQRHCISRNPSTSTKHQVPCSQCS